MRLLVAHDPVANDDGAPVDARTERGFADDAAELVRALVAGDPRAQAAFFDRYQASVQRVLVRVLGADSELGDLLHDVFLRALRGVHAVKNPLALGDWLTRIAVCTAIDCLRARKRRRWLSFLPFEQLPEPAVACLDEDAREGVRGVYALLDTFPIDERMAFSLRVLAGMELTIVAEHCGCSLATAKRRIARAEARFLVAAREHPTLRAWLEAGDRWGAQP